MSYTITQESKNPITLAPSSVYEEVMQNLTMVLSTVKNSVPLDRTFGLSARFLDQPTSAAKALLVAEILDAVEQVEPRAEILEITFEQAETVDKLIPRLEVQINAE